MVSLAVLLLKYVGGTTAHPACLDRLRCSKFIKIACSVHAWGPHSVCTQMRADADALSLCMEFDSSQTDHIEALKETLQIQSFLLLRVGLCACEHNFSLCARSLLPVVSCCANVGFPLVGVKVSSGGQAELGVPATNHEVLQQSRRRI